MPTDDYEPVPAAPDSVALAEASAGQYAAYVHIPFCRRICPYCDFAVTSDAGLSDRFVAAVVAEIEAATPFDEPLAAVAIGGGTPTAIPTTDLGRVIRALEETFGFVPDVEISVEANPEDVTTECVAGLREVRVSRLSLGVQSFDDMVLDDLGRSHRALEAIRAVELAREVFGSVSVDLIFGSPAESDTSWEESVATALGLGIQHLSTYALTVERGTPLSRAVNGGAPAPDPDAQAERWEVASALARDAGMVRYETSNHARPGHAVVYNLITWGQGEYAAFGNGAHRHRSGRRSWNVRRVDRYVERIEQGESPESGHEILDAWEREVERVMLGLRRAAGVEAGAAGERLLASSDGVRLLDAGVISSENGRLRITRPFLSDEVSRSLLALSPGDC